MSVRLSVAASALTALAAVTALVAVSLPSPAQACGGFFCNSSELVAVDQVRERILFEVNGDGTVTANVEIAYVGEPSDFAWVVPVPAQPELGVLPVSTLTALDVATSPRLQPPSIVFPGDDDDDDAAGDDDDDDVTVIELDQVGPFEPTFVSSTDPAAMAAWLTDNGYLITAEMEPLVAHYVNGGMHFLGLKLAPDSGTADIAPIRMTYPATEVMVPLVLTAAAAEPDMGVLVFIAGQQRYAPSNWDLIEFPPDTLKADPRNGWNNYYPLISYLVDEAGGQGMVSQYSDTTDDAASRMTNYTWEFEDGVEVDDFMDDLSTRLPWITRLFTRMNPEEMISDPVFDVVAGGAQSTVVSIGGQVCWDAPSPPACARTYCGSGGSCGVTANDDVGCLCDEGFVARAIRAPDASSIGSIPTVVCQDVNSDRMASVVDQMEVDPCASYSCGANGACTTVGGMPTCDCDAGYMAVRSGAGIACAEAAETFNADIITWPDWPPPIEDCGDDDDDDDTAPDDDDTPDDDDDVTADDDDDVTGANDDDASADDDDDDDTAPECGCAASPVTDGGALPAGLAAGLLGLVSLRRRRGARSSS